MKLVRFNATDEPVSRARTGVWLAGDVIGDLRAGYADALISAGDAQGRALAALRLPHDLRLILHAGSVAWAAVQQAADRLAMRLRDDGGEARGIDGEPLFVPAVHARLHNPLKPGRFLLADNGEAPLRMRQRPGAIAMGPVRDLSLPRGISELRYRIGLALVLRECAAVTADHAASAVVGCMAATEIEGIEDDVSLAGDALFQRCIIGPALVAALDWLALEQLQATTRVNGTVIARGPLGDATRPLPQIVAALTRYGCEAGDVIVVASPAAASTLRAGDLLETEVPGLGALRNRVVPA